jgi:hypothetical protein
VTPRRWSKNYPSRASAQRAAENHGWLTAAGLRTPALLAHDPSLARLEFERLSARHPSNDQDLGRVAAELGAWHGTLAQRLRVDPHPRLTARGTPLAQFAAARAEPLRRSSPPDALVGIEHLPLMAFLAANTAPSVYKDLNLRNVLLDDQCVWHVDFDDLTLAPAGYDLAKLLVSWAMTYGRRPPLTELLDRYNASAGERLCDPRPFALWLEVHYVLTHRYGARSGYRFDWAELRTAADRREVSALLASAPR